MPDPITIDAPGAPRFYVLDQENDPIRASEAAWQEASAGGPTIIAEDEIAGGKVWTQFSGMDFAGEDRPLLFVTLSLFGEDGMEERRYRTWGEAEAGHGEVVERYRSRFERGRVIPMRGV